MTPSPMRWPRFPDQTGGRIDARLDVTERRLSAEQFRGLGYCDEAAALALHLLGRAQGVAVIAHVYQDAELLRHEIAQLENWVSQLGR